MSGKLFDRSNRMSRSVPSGSEILHYLRSSEARALLTKAAAQGVMPLSAVSNRLISVVGAEALKSARSRQFCGAVARAVLAEEGFEVAEANVRVRGDPVFKSGAVYRRVSKGPDKLEPLLQRFLDTLSPAEARAAVGYLEARMRRNEMQPDDPANLGEP